MYGEIRKPDYIEFENWPLEVFNILTLSEWEEMTTLILKGYPINASDEELDTFIDGFSSIKQGFAGTFVYIITHNSRPTICKIRFYAGNLKELVLKLKNDDEKNIFIDGGAEIVSELLEEKHIDEFYISIIPVLLGDGVSLFLKRRPEQILKLISAKQYETGLTQIIYKTVCD